MKRCVLKKFRIFGFLCLAIFGYCVQPSQSLAQTEIFGQVSCYHMTLSQLVKNNKDYFRICKKDKRSCLSCISRDWLKNDGGGYIMPADAITKVSMGFFRLGSTPNDYVSVCYEADIQEVEIVEREVNGENNKFVLVNRFDFTTTLDLSLQYCIQKNAFDARAVLLAEKDFSNCEAVEMLGPYEFFPEDEAKPDVIAEIEKLEAALPAAR